MYEKLNLGIRSYGSLVCNILPKPRTRHRYPHTKSSLIRSIAPSHQSTRPHTAPRRITLPPQGPSHVASSAAPRAEAAAAIPALLHRLVQGRRKWDGGGGGEPETRRIRAEAPCPRCSKHMGVLFSGRPRPPPSTAGGGYQGLNPCPSCRTAYFFLPHLPVLLQGTFVAVGCARAAAPDGHQPESLRSRSPDLFLSVHVLL